MAEDNLNNLLVTLQPVLMFNSDTLDGTDLPGIVFRLSSLTITKALIHLESPSPASSRIYWFYYLCFVD